MHNVFCRCKSLFVPRPTYGFMLTLSLKNEFSTKTSISIVYHFMLILTTLVKTDHWPIYIFMLTFTLSTKVSWDLLLTDTWIHAHFQADKATGEPASKANHCPSRPRLWHAGPGAGRADVHDAVRHLHGPWAAGRPAGPAREDRVPAQGVGQHVPLAPGRTRQLQGVLSIRAAGMGNETFISH